MNRRHRQWIHRAARRFLGDEEYRRLIEFRFGDEGFGYDRFGFEKETTIAAYLLLRILYVHYFRVESTGIENVPERGPAILAPNHSGVVPFDGAMLSVDLVANLTPPRYMRTVVDHFVFRFPYIGLIFNRMGHFVGTRRNFVDVLGAGELVCVFPEGHKGTGKLFVDRYRLLPFNVGHVEIALETRVPIVPVGIVGAEEQAPMLLDARPLARLLGLPYFPITPTFPWLGPLGCLPLPVKYRIYYGEPLAFHEEYGPERSRDPVLVHRLAGVVRARVNELLQRGLAEREGVFW